jgi:hypothetical protein
LKPWTRFMKKKDLGKIEKVIAELDLWRLREKENIS